MPIPLATLWTTLPTLATLYYSSAHTMSLCICAAHTVHSVGSRLVSANLTARMRVSVWVFALRTLTRLSALGSLSLLWLHFCASLPCSRLPKAVCERRWSFGLLHLPLCPHEWAFTNSDSQIRLPASLVRLGGQHAAWARPACPMSEPMSK